MAKAKRKTKAEELAEAVAEAVGAGRELHLESVDFSDPNRPKTCLEVDFPILPINHVAAIEGNAGKPIYQMSKWWARRRSSVFRAMLIAAATKAPEDQGEAAKVVWDAYYGNHQKNEAFRKLKVADIFMGGGTTIVEGARLGMQMYGNDLNPVAWLVVKNELAQVDSSEVQALLDEIEAEVKPQIMPFYACDCPRGHKGKWTHKLSGNVMGDDFDPLSLKPEQRPEYEYEGPEVIYTFWAKHGPCQASECNHRTPIMSSPVVATKMLTVKAWTGKQCRSCNKKFDIEQKDARMAPAAMLVVAEGEIPYAVMKDDGHYSCPHCGHESHDPMAAGDGQSSSLGRAKNKKIELTLLIHPDWLKGSPGKDSDGNKFGGSVTDRADITAAWNKERSKSLKLIEVRGKLPDTIVCPDNGQEIRTDAKGGTVPRQAHFTCQQCGLDQKVMESVSLTHTHAPVTEYVLQGYCGQCDELGIPYGGRFFSSPDHTVYDSANALWEVAKDTKLSGCWATEKIPFGNRTHIKDPLHKHGYTHWWQMFNCRQLLVHSLLVKALKRHSSTYESACSFAIGAFQQYLRNQNMFCIWNLQRDTPEPFFSNNNFNPKNRVAENNVFSKLGRGNWQSCSASLFNVLDWRSNPWDILPLATLSQIAPELADKLTGKSTKVSPCDSPLAPASLTCESSTELSHIPDGSLDLVITDPPFGDLIQYAELSDFFYVWLRLLLREGSDTATLFSADHSPKALEAVTNETRHPEDADGFYKKVLAECWRNASRKLKPSGLLSFTFHHSEDEPWVAVLESLFESGFILEATFPIRSDETKGKGEFGSQKIEFDIVHVCRKRLEEPEPISWARLRRQIMKDVRQLQEIIEQHQKEGLGEADLQVIRRGKALEYFSRHYGKVYIEKGREDEFTVKDALVGINQLLDDESDTTSEAPPVLAEPYTRQFLRLFADQSSLERDQMQKYLRGTGVSPSEFLERGWCSETKRIFRITPPLEWAQQWKGKSRKGMSRDFDQTYFLIGACYEDSGIKLSDTLNSGSFVPHPAISDLLDWFGKHGSDSEMRNASRTAKKIYSSWLAKNTKQASIQRTLFDLADDES
ncbi:MAG TPA: site-specific DNA-methyltransferase [Gimesia maris]|uniref:Site-specific DNA-methyltransferase n=1 Tax=Gimesia maris TaxID=122 RepID=A0A3D3R627_9PLAN|nr:site-specific DNA-methyltransferase [Gimesia maris]